MLKESSRKYPNKIAKAIIFIIFMAIVVIGCVIQSTIDCAKEIGKHANKFWKRYEV